MGVAGRSHQDQLITCGDPWVIAYNPANGEELWRAECMGDDLAPSPIYAGGLVLAIESNIKMVAIRPDGRGDVTKTHILWMVEDGIPDICSPVSNGELIFLLTTDGTLTCYRLTDHAKLWEQD
ncbi:MAG: outer membrane protein assembly factor BamB family protein, partial [Planctomycetota bacterium]